MAKEYDFKVVDLENAMAFEAKIKLMLAQGYALHGNMVVL